MLAAPSSGSGKTVLTLSLLRLMRRMGCLLSSAKVGPDYIDPVFHYRATGRPCFNLDLWAMDKAGLQLRLRHSASESDLLLIESAMGLYDGGEKSSGAALAKTFNIPILLILDVKGQAETAAAIVRGIRDHDHTVTIAGVILNRVGSSRHEAMIRNGFSADLPPIVGAVPTLPPLSFPSRHLGLIQASEHEQLDELLNRTAEAIEPYVDWQAIQTAARPLFIDSAGYDTAPFSEIQHLAIAWDAAFAFVYPHHLEDWRRLGKNLSFFSPLADQGPDPQAEAVFLPGGYPELHAGRLAAATNFHVLMAEAARNGKIIYGECGGYMVLGEALIDVKKQQHAMLGLLPLISDFSNTKLQLGYREVELLADGALGTKGTKWRGHEFHYATIKSEGEGEPLLNAHDREGRCLGKIGRRRGKIAGSFFHMIDPVSPEAALA